MCDTQPSVGKEKKKKPLMEQVELSSNGTKLCRSCGSRCCNDTESTAGNNSSAVVGLMDPEEKRDK